MTHVESANDIIHLHNIEPPYNIRLESKESLIPEPRSTPSSTPISTISNSLVLVRNNCQPTQASNARIHQLYDSTELEVSTLASST